MQIYWSLNPGPPYQNLWGWGPAVFSLTRPPGDSYAHQNWRTTGHSYTNQASYFCTSKEEWAGEEINPLQNVLIMERKREILLATLWISDLLLSIRWSWSNINVWETHLETTLMIESIFSLLCSVPIAPRIIFLKIKSGIPSYSKIVVSSLFPMG